jgi:hypothetical protein
MGQGQIFKHSIAKAQPAQSVASMTADQMVCGSILARAKKKRIFLCSGCSEFTAHFLEWLSPSAESPMVGADDKP